MRLVVNGPGVNRALSFHSLNRCGSIIVFSLLARPMMYCQYFLSRGSGIMLAMLLMRDVQAP